MNQAHVPAEAKKNMSHIALTIPISWLIIFGIP
jgi:hypothetical protein